MGLQLHGLFLGRIHSARRKLTLYALNEALIRGRSASAAVSRHQVASAAKLRIHGRPLSAQHWQCAVVALLLPMLPAQDQKTEPKPKPRFLAQNRTETDRP